MADELISGGTPGGDSGAGLEGATSQTAGTTAASTPEQEFEIKWNGRTEKLPWAKASEYAQKGYDYTQKMQALAKERDEFGGQRQRYDQALAEVRTFLGDRARVKAYLDRMQADGGGAGGDQSATEDEVITARTLEQRMKEAQTGIANFTQTQLATLREQIQVENLAGQYAAELGAHANALKTQFPELKVIPRIDEILKQDVRSMGPRSIEEAKTFMIDVAKNHSQSIKNFMLEQRKGQTDGATNPASGGIEPRGGAAPMPQATNQKFKSIHGDDFKNVVIAEMMALANKK